jgi:hypothetical protein
MRLISTVTAIVLALTFAVPTLAATERTYKATMPGPGPTGTVAVTIEGSSGTLHWNLSRVARNSMLVVEIRGGKCSNPLGLVVRSRWGSSYATGRAVRTVSLTSTWVGYFNRNWSQRGGDVAIVKNAGHTECRALVRQ